MNPKKTMEWLKQNAKDLSFDAVCDDISISSTFFPLEFQMDGDMYHATLSEDLTIKSESGDTFRITRDDFYVIWDKIRSESVFPISKHQEENLVYAMLCSLHYLDPIMIFDINNDTEILGFQLRAGIGRVFALNGVAV